MNNNDKLRVYIVSNSKYHKKVYDRVDAALKISSDVTLFCYDKGFISPSPLLNEIKCVSVGKPKDFSYVNRIYFSIKMAIVLLVDRVKNGVPDIVLANTAEHMIISSAMLFGTKSKLYDLADINPIQYNKGVVGRIFRFVERYCLKNIKWTCLVTSPWFYWDYFIGVLNIKPKSILVENKLNYIFSPIDYSFYKEKSRIVIAWTGILRCNKSLEMLIELVDSFPECFIIKLIGVTDLLDDGLLNKVRLNDSFVFVGPYETDQLRDKVNGCHFMWCGDFTDGLNSNILLPNRLYQAIAFGLPLLVPTSSVLSKICDKFGIGIKYDSNSINGLCSILKELGEDDYLKIRNNCLSLSGNVIRKNEWSDILSLDSNHASSLYLPDEEDLSILFR